MRQFIKRILYCFIFFFTFLLLMYIIAFCVGKPELNKDRYIKLYDDQNKIFYQSVNNYSGQYVSIDDVSPYFLKAIVAIEDKRFYSHHGSDYVGISRAIKTNVIKRKNIAPQNLPPDICSNTFGSVTNIRLGPLSVGILYDIHAGNMITPDIIATNVSSNVIWMPSPTSARSFPI